MSPTLNKTETVGAHTRLPWVAYPYLSPKGKAFIKSLYGPAVYTGNTLTEDDALFIVKACNSYENLLTELQQARQVIANLIETFGDSGAGIVLKSLDAAIAKATGGA